MGGVAIGIQSSPEISSLVVGAIRIVIDLALKFTTFFSRLTDMICIFQDYLAPLEKYAEVADIKMVEDFVVKAYANILQFGWKARQVFVDVSGNHRKWTSIRAFIRDHWDNLEAELASIQEKLQHNLNMLLHAAQAPNLHDTRKAEQSMSRLEPFQAAQAHSHPSRERKIEIS